ncbi:MAG TPA: energy-coupling factor ABC transporter ATP-binding protein [Anaerohalosphaeraceae bacterium]|nr:energy-coupling factor ABC transporter ATP-binding protein [Anaerohalosphaeraceae bacterium]
MSHHLVEADNLFYTYPDGTAALQGISFRITHGQSVALVGGNGAGKSTLLLHLCGCLLPTKGTLRIGNLPVSRQTLSAIRKTVGMVFQDPDDQLFMPTVYEDAAFGPHNLGLDAQQVRPVVEEALRRTGVLHLQNRPPFRLSAGEKRRAAIASVLAMSPDILVLDEPSANLDPQARRELIDLLRSFEHTKIIATHDLDLAMDLCERTIVLEGGRVVLDGSTEEVFQNEKVLSKARLSKPLRLQGCPLCGRNPSPSG